MSSSFSDEEGTSFKAAFAGVFASPENTGKRLKAERRAAMTPKQRARKAVRVVQVNFRASKETKAMITALAARLDVSEADVLEMAVMTLAEAKGLKHA